MIPDFQSCMRPLLAAVQNGQIHHFSEVIQQLCLHFELSDAEVAQKLPSGKQSIIRNRVAWARTYLNKAGLLTAPGRSQLQITERGQSALQQVPGRIDIGYLKQFPEFVAFHSKKASDDKTSEQSHSESENSF